MKNTGSAKHLVVISYDAFSADNWETAKSQPNMSGFIENGAYSNQLKSVYPSLTYVVHTTMVTGVNPAKHGIIHNNPLQPFTEDKNQRWHWFRDSIKVPVIYDAVKDAGMRCAGILWPVTGKASIRYNMPEIVAINGENQILKILKNGNPFYCIEMALKYGKVRRGIRQPYLDNFTTLCAIDTIKNKKPGMLLLHLTDLDDTKHRYGTDSAEVEKTIVRMDKRLGDLYDAVQNAGIGKDTVFIIIGDHGQLNVRYKVYLNNLLKEMNLISGEGTEKTWRAYFQSAGGSAYLHIKPGDEEAEKKVMELLENSLIRKKYGIEYIRNFTHQAEPTLRYTVEAKKEFSFDERLNPVTKEDLSLQNIKYATHGYSPDTENYRCNIIISGKMIKKDYQFGEIEMIDIAPVMAKILGIQFNHGDGRCRDELFMDPAKP